MKHRIFNGVTVTVLGLLVSLGPQFLFKACGPLVGSDGPAWMKCHWSVQAELGMGALIAALGIAILVFRSRDIRLGLLVGVLFAAVPALLVPHVLIGGCAMRTMACQALTFPAITVLAVLLLFFSAGNIFYFIQKRKEKKA
ncbi:MAG: DUF4418 family protein [Treponema sp.]|jgi:hypothetical protein|nr:DUF4418 family protein [Treponema sp.]